MCNLRVPLPARSQRDAEALRFGDFARLEFGIWKLGEPADLPLRLAALLLEFHNSLDGAIVRQPTRGRGWLPGTSVN
jgi:hypothetical protein